MFKKRKMIYMFMIFFCLSITACKKDSSEAEKNRNLSENLMGNQESQQGDTEQKSVETVRFPAHYGRDTGTIKADFDVEIPEDFDTSAVKKIQVHEERLADLDVVYAQFIENKEIKEQDIIEETEETPEDHIYFLESGEQIVSGGWFFYTSPQNKYYTSISPWFVAESEYSSDYEVDFATGESCVEHIQEILGILGYPIDEYDFYFCPVSHKDMEKREAEYISNGLLKSEAKKEYWSETDDVYCIYAYQKAEGLPIIHENMMTGYYFITDTYDNAPITAIYSADGIVSLTVNNVYSVVHSDELVAFADLDQIVDTVIEKYSYLLTDSTFTITRGKLCQMVRKNNQQEYETQPVWYFEITENDSKVSYMLVNAETAEEVSLGSVGDMFG